MKLFNKVAIVGVGLIGGSLGLAIKKRRLADRVIGISRKAKTLKIAKKLKAIDEGYQDIGEVAGSDLVILCAPVKAIIKLFSGIAPFVSCGAIITDVGSTKAEIVNAAQMALPKDTDFIGAHPLAGSEKKGANYALADMFCGSLCILTPVKHNKKQNVRKLKLFWERLGARIKVLAPPAHDKMLSFTSHLPHLAAFGLIDAVPGACLSYGASGLKDITRIAASDPVLWTEIFLTNKRNVLQSVKSFQKRLSDFSALIRSGDYPALKKKIQNAKSRREKLNSLKI